jgi:hypothetical protein
MERLDVGVRVMMCVGRPWETTEQLIMKRS